MMNKRLGLIIFVAGVSIPALSVFAASRIDSLAGCLKLREKKILKCQKSLNKVYRTKGDLTATFNSNESCKVLEELNRTCDSFWLKNKSELDELKVMLVSLHTEYANRPGIVTSKKMKDLLRSINNLEKVLYTDDASKQDWTLIKARSDQANT